MTYDRLRLFFCPVWLDKVLFAAGLLWFSLIYVPWFPLYFSSFPGVEHSWIMALHHFFQVQKQFGTEVVFTYGPYGFLASYIYHPITFKIVFAAYAFFFLLFAETGWFILSRLKNVWLRFVCWVVMLTFSIPPGDNFFFMACVLSFLAFDAAKGQPVPLRNYFLIFALALLALIKFSYIFAILPVLVWITFDSLFSRRRFPWFVLYFIGFYLLLWAMAGQNFSNLGAYFRNSWELVSGYAQALQSPTYPQFGYPEILYILATGFLTAAVMIIKNKEPLYEVLKHGSFIAWVSFVVFKCAFIRVDVQHIMIAVFFAPALILLYLPVLATSFNQKTVKGLLILALSLALMNAGIGAYKYKINLWKYLTGPIVSLPSSTDELRKISFSKTMHQLASENLLPQSSGSSDVYSYWQNILLAAGLPYNPRPVIHSYAAYTSRLAKINARHLAGARAPDSIFFIITQSDGRLPSMEDGLSWLEIATRYLPVTKKELILLLQKKPSPRSYHFTPISTITAHWNETIPVPSAGSGKVWAEIKIKPTVWNRILGLLFKPIPVSMRIQMAQKSQEFPFIPSLGEAGFLLSPLVMDNDTFITTFYDLPSETVRDLKVSRIMFYPASGKSAYLFFEKNIEISFFELTLKPKIILKQNK